MTVSDILRSTTTRKASEMAQDVARQAFKELVKEAVREVNEETAAANRSAKRRRSGLLLVGTGVALGYLLGSDVDADELVREANEIRSSLADADELDDFVSVDVTGEPTVEVTREDDSSGRLLSLLAVVAVGGLAAAGYLTFARSEESDDIGRRGPTESGDGSGSGEESGVDTSLETGVDVGTGIDEGVGTDTEVEDVEGTAPGGVNENEAASESPDEGGYGSAESGASTGTADEGQADESEESGE